MLEQNILDLNLRTSKNGFNKKTMFTLAVKEMFSLIIKKDFRNLIQFGQIRSKLPKNARENNQLKILKNILDKKSKNKI